MSIHRNLVNWHNHCAKLHKMFTVMLPTKVLAEQFDFND